MMPTVRVLTAQKQKTRTSPKPWPSISIPALYVLRHGAPEGEMTIKRQEHEAEMKRRREQSAIGDLPAGPKTIKPPRRKSLPGVQTNWKPNGVNWRTLPKVARDARTAEALGRKAKRKAAA